ncbi:GGDEF domain-containing protein [Butyrivibrio fibrisolvens]|uniref:GGDEF domain-containing protein n=1 Tax=Butyrivibrio fibrisolvens TaxID=831 RepID=UPI0004014CB5|nr:diguanylate cyclase [Butyrivibrio fibrisolvens]
MTVKNINVILWFILILFTTLFMSQIILHSENTAPVIEEDRLYVTLNDVYRGRSSAEKINAFTDSYSFNRGDRIIVTFSLPDKKYDFPTLMLATQFVGYTISLDGTPIYERRLEEAKNGDFLPKDVNFITLPYDEYEGKELSIEMIVSQSGSKTIIYTPSFGNFNDLSRGYTWDRALSVFLGTFMCMFGVIYFLISLFFAVRIRGLASQIRSSILCVCGGAWILTSQRINIIFMTNTTKPALYEYTLLYISLPLIMLLFCTICHLHHNRIALGYILGVCAIEVIFGICHFTRIRYINTFSKPIAIIYAISVIGFMIYSVFYLRRRKASTYDKVQIAGLNTLSICLIIASIFFALDRNQAREFNNAASIFIGLGGIVFVASRVMTFMVTLSNADPMKKKEIALSSLAYKDSLTGLPNRASCDKETIQLDETTDDYLIMSMDLNGLKEVNDSKGHKAGDELLQNFTNVLNVCFPEPFFKGRTGGDEFVVILKDVSDESNVDSNIDHMNKLLKAKEKETGFDHSVAYGLCYRHELPKGASAHEVYMEADARMYKLKRAQHEARKSQK